MSSPSDPTSPQRAGPAAVAAPPRRRSSLRRAVAMAFAPLVVVVVAGIFVLLLDARTVHRDLQRMFEELREVALARSLTDELHGFEQWVEAVPEATKATHPLVIADLHHHREAARATFARFQVPDDPSEPAHTDEEAGILQRIATSLERLGGLIDSGEPIGAMRDPLAVALQAAGALTHAVESETHAIGDQLDQRSRRISEFMLLLGLASVTTVTWLGVLLVRRVLVPVRELRNGVQALGRGELGVVVPIRHADELGELAATFRLMSQQMSQGREELEHRVEERSREVLRTARLADLGSMAAGIAHEINNPLASIATCAEGLLRETAGNGAPDVQNLREYLQIMRKEAMRTRDITARLLRFSRNDHASREIVWLGSELREVSPMFTHQFADAGVALRLVVDGVGPAILGDASEWRQVVFNLLRNALDASPRGTQVTVACRSDAEQVVLEVADEGAGIRPEDFERLFEPFFTTKAPGHGTGLGLAIVHRIVTAHGGRVGAENRSPRGALFRVVVPAAQPSALRGADA